MTSLKGEIVSLKEEFASLQKFFREKIISMEAKINEMENKLSVDNQLQNDCVLSNMLPPQDLDNETRNIIETLMWESTLSEAVLHVQKRFKDNNSREKFLRCSLELVLEKDEQYRKMAGTLFGYLITQNVINQTNVFNSLSSVLLVIENSNNYNTKMWQNLTEILLPMIMESHIKFLQLQRRAQTILKQEYYYEFIRNLSKAMDMNKKRKYKNKPFDISLSQSINFAQSTNLEPNIDKKEHKVDMLVPETYHANCNDIENVYETESFSKYKPPFENLETDERTKCDVENLINNLKYENVKDTLMQLKELGSMEIENLLERIIDKSIQKETEQRMVVGGFFVAAISDHIIDSRQLLMTFCKCILKVERLIMNQNTRIPICEAFAEILLPLFSENYLKLHQLSMIASLSLPDEIKTIFLWFMEKIMNEKGIIIHQTKPQTNGVTSKLIKRIRKYMDVGMNLTESEKEDHHYVDNDKRWQKKSTEIVEKHRQIQETKFEDKNNANDQTEHETFLTLKRKKLVKERMENIGDKMDIKIDDLLNDQSIKKAQEGEIADTQLKLDGQLGDTEQIPVKQPENLPSSAIKEKMQEIIEHLMESGNMQECVAIVKDTFNECQTDLVFKAAFEYTKNKPSVYRIQSGTLVSETFKHDPKRIGAQIMNTISLELGDFEDVPELWNSMAEIICPAILNGLIRFSDLKLLPKYFLHTTHCASLLLAIFKQIIQQSGPEWLEENWKKSKLDLSTFLPLNLIYKFIIENNLQFIVKEDEFAYYEKNSSD